MNFFATYLLGRLLFRIKEFAMHWYYGAFLNVTNHTLNFLGSLDETIALRITLRNFFRPLYGDWSPVGRILGIVFRSGRVVIGIAIYPVIIAVAMLIYAAWAAIPVALFLRIIGIWP